jgi:ATP-dependent helicase HrpA
MRAEDLLPAAADPLPDRSAYPDKLSAGPLKLDVNYRFQPGDERDGLSVDVPLAAWGQVDPQQLEWLVPGLLEEKLTQLIRTLPKSIRRGLVPAPDSARKAVALLDFGREAFLPAVAQALSQVAGETIPVQALDVSRLPHHLRVHVRVLDEDGKVVAQGRDWDELRRTLPSDDAASQGTIADQQWMRDHITRWDLDAFPDEVQVERGGLRLIAYPALIDRGESVSLRLLNQRAVAARETRRGLRRLVCLAEHRELRSQVHWLPQIEQLQLFASTLPYQCDLRTQVAEMLAELAYVAKQAVPRDAEQFQLYLRWGRRELPVVVQDAAHLLVPLWENYHQLRLKLDETRAPQLADAVAELEEQLRALLPEGFLANTPWTWLKHVPRYLAAMLHRLDKLTAGGAARDTALRDSIRPLWNAYCERLAEHTQRGLFDPELETYRWLLEELRVSLFAQHLGTAARISFPRLEKQWAKTTT